LAAIRATALHLWPRSRPAGNNQTLGSLLITGIDGPWSGDGGLRVGIEYRPPKEETAERRLVELYATILSSWPTRRPHGRVRLLPDPPGQAGVIGGHTTSHWWIWSLTSDEVETIERERGPNAAAETLTFNLEVNGIAAVGTETWGFGGDVQFSLATADWLTLLRSLGYTTPPSLRDLAGQSVTLGPSWAWAEEKIRAARRHLTLGEDREALRTAYLLFDAIARNPFRAAWDDVLDDDMPAEKAEIIGALLKAQATALNKLGRHPSDELTDGRDRAMLPLDHWEAELLIGLAQMLLAAVERWRSIREAHERERAPTSADAEAPG
jgi:hypothetical protein